MKTAYLILAHANPKQLERLIGRLIFSDTDIYVHLDLKSDMRAFSYLSVLPNVFFIRNRVKVAWGAYSIVQATVNGFREIVASGKDYGYVHLLSGQDYPLKSNIAIHAFFEANPGKAFMHSLDVYAEWQEAIPRLEYYHLTNYHFPGKFKAEEWMRKLLPKRKMPAGLVPVGRSQWFSISLVHVQYILQFLKENAAVVRFFKFSWAPDELIFQTILFSSPYKKDMVNDNLRYIDWSEGGASPKTITMADKEALAASGKFFARKFNPEVDEKILDWIDQNLV